MKSTTTMPPRSRSRSCRTISSAASRLLRVTVCSRLPPCPVNLPVLTSLTGMASVVSITREPPRGGPPPALQRLGDLLVDPVRGEDILVVGPPFQSLGQVGRHVADVLVHH